MASNGKKIYFCLNKRRFHFISILNNQMEYSNDVQPTVFKEFRKKRRNLSKLDMGTNSQNCTVVWRSLKKQLKVLNLRNKMKFWAIIVFEMFYLTTIASGHPRPKMSRESTNLGRINISFLMEFIIPSVLKKEKCSKILAQQSGPVS